MRRTRSGVITVVLLLLMGVLGILLWAHYTQYFSSLRMARTLDETLARRVAVEDLLDLALARAEGWMNEPGHALRALALSGGEATIDARRELAGYEVPGELSARSATVGFQVIARAALPAPAGPLEGRRTVRATATLTFATGRTATATRVMSARVANVRASPALAHTLAITRAQDQYWQSSMDGALDWNDGPGREPKDSPHHAWHRYNSPKNRLRVLPAADGMREGPVFFGPRPAYDANQPVLLNASMSPITLGFLRGSQEAGRKPSITPSGAEPASTDALWRSIVIHLYERKAGVFGLRVAGPFSIDVFLVLYRTYSSPPRPWSPPNAIRLLEPDGEIVGWGRPAAKPDYERLLLPEALCSLPGGTRALEPYFAALATRRDRVPLISFLDEAGLAENEPMTLALTGARSICGPVATRGLRLLTLGVNWQLYRSYFLPLPVLPSGPEDGAVRDSDVLAQVEQMAGPSLWPKGKPGRRLARVLRELKAQGGWHSYVAIRRGAPASGDHRETFDLPQELADRTEWLTNAAAAHTALGGDLPRVAYDFPSWAAAKPVLEVEPGTLRVNGILRVGGAVSEPAGFRYTGQGVLSAAGAVTLGDEVTRAGDGDALVLVARNAPLELKPAGIDPGGEKVFQAALVALSDQASGPAYLASAVSSAFARAKIEGLVAESALGVHPELSIQRDSARFDRVKDDDACVVSLCRMPVHASREMGDGGDAR